MMRARLHPSTGPVDAVPGRHSSLPTGTAGTATIRAMGRQRLPRLAAFAAALLLGGLTSHPLAAQELPADPLPVALGSPTTNTITLEDVQLRLAAVTNLVGRSEIVWSNLTQIYLAAQSRLLNAETLRQRTADSQHVIEAVPAELTELQSILANPPTNPVPRVLLDSPVAELDQVVAEVGADLVVARSQKETLDAEPKRRADRTIEISTLQSQSRSQLSELEKALDAPLNGQDPIQVAERVRLLARRQLHQAELAAFQKEMEEFKATSGLLVPRQALAARRISLLEKEQAMLKDALTSRRQVEASEAAARAADSRRQAEVLNVAVVRNLAATNQLFAQTRIALNQKVNLSSRQLDAALAELADIRSKFQEVQSRVQTVSHSGLSRNYAIGLALRRTEYSLPSPRRYEVESASRADELSLLQLDQLLAYEDRKEVADVEAHVETAER